MIRRQPFITESYYRNLCDLYDLSEGYWLGRQLDEDLPGQEESLRLYEVKQSSFKGLVIRYTAGEPVEQLIVPLEKLVANYERYQKSLAVYEGRENISPLNISRLPAHFEECVQVISLCILLGRLDLLERFVHLFDAAGFYGHDTLYEDLLVRSLPGRADVDEWYYDVYTLLIKAIHAPDKAKSAELLDEYCNGWYESFEGLQTIWHDSHLDIDGDEGRYFGYWAFEAGAIAYLYDIDDSAISNMVYPRDLVEYARHAKAASPSIIAKVYPGQPCPRTGYWFTPAQNNSRRLFRQGDVMPEFKGSSWGDTIWYWSGDTE
jgi:hypothetical protein